MALPWSERLWVISQLKAYSFHWDCVHYSNFVKTLLGMGEVEMGIEAWVGGSLEGIMSKSP